jgi:capsular exopolysaccharide synthesis family protein
MERVDLREALATLRAAWWMPLVGALLGAVTGFGICWAQTPLYTSPTQLFVSSTDSGSTSDFVQGSEFSQQRVASYAQLLMGERLAARVVDALSLDMTPQELSHAIEATPVPDTVLIDVTVTDPSPQRAQEIARAVGSEFSDMVSEFESRGAGHAAPIEVFVAEDPMLPTAVSSPKIIRTTAVSLVLGILAGVGLAIGRRRLDRSVKDTDVAADLAGAPVIGTVAVDRSIQQRPVVEEGMLDRVAEDFRRIRTNLQFLSVDEPPRVIMVSSALPEEGKTTLTANLALTLADAGRTVTVVEADLRRPRLTRYLGLVGGAGLSNVLAGTADIDDVLQQYGDGRLSVIAAGPTPPNPGELLASSHMAAFLGKLRARNDYVLLDAPPLLPVADSAGLAVHTDGSLLAVRYGKTRADQLEQAAATLERVGSKTLGVVLNFMPPKADIAAAYGYGYAYKNDVEARS